MAGGSLEEMIEDEFFDEINRIKKDREEKDYYEFARGLSGSADIFRKRYSNWIAEEFKHLRFYANFLYGTTTGYEKDRVLQHLRKMDDLEKESITLLLSLQGFVQQIERLKPSEIIDVAELLIRYKGMVDPIEDRIIRELLDIRISLLAT